MGQATVLRCRVLGPGRALAPTTFHLGHPSPLSFAGPPCIVRAPEVAVEPPLHFTPETSQPALRWLSLPSDGSALQHAGHTFPAPCWGRPGVFSQAGRSERSAEGPSTAGPSLPSLPSGKEPLSTRLLSLSGTQAPEGCSARAEHTSLPGEGPIALGQPRPEGSFLNSRSTQDSHRELGFCPRWGGFPESQ